MVNDELNVKLWDNLKLRDDVKKGLEAVMHQFLEDIEIPVEVVDATLVGSNASYNYTPNSDIDLHIVVNTNVMPYDKRTLKLYLNSARNRFNKDYSMTIKGIPVEVSIEDVDSTVNSNGIYSIMNNTWIKNPEPVFPPAYDVRSSDSYHKLVNKINNALSNPYSEEIKSLINQLYLVRKNSISVDGEFGPGNLIFKAIRDDGLLQKLKDELYNILSKELTVENLSEEFDSKSALWALNRSE